MSQVWHTSRLDRTASPLHEERWQQGIRYGTGSIANLTGNLEIDFQFLHLTWEESQRVLQQLQTLGTEVIWRTRQQVDGEDP